MSRIGRMPIDLPQGVKVDIKGNEVKVTGPKGELDRSFNPQMTISQRDNQMVVTRPSDERQHRALHGLTRTLLSNMVQGVTAGYEKTLDIVGVGYKAEKKGDNLIFKLGYSHTIEVKPLPGVTLVVEGNNRIKVSGTNKETVGQQAAEIRALRKPDAYKGKGVRYAGEHIKLKAGKAAGKA
jgi:large subunit ribosomal protein L6